MVTRTPHQFVVVMHQTVACQPPRKSIEEEVHSELIFIFQHKLFHHPCFDPPLFTVFFLYFQVYSNYRFDEIHILFYTHLLCFYMLLFVICNDSG